MPGVTRQEGPVLPSHNWVLNLVCCTDLCNDCRMPSTTREVFAILNQNAACKYKSLSESWQSLVGVSGTSVPSTHPSKMFQITAYDFCKQNAIFAVLCVMTFALVLPVASTVYYLDASDLQRKKIVRALSLSLLLGFLAAALGVVDLLLPCEVHPQPRAVSRWQAMKTPVCMSVAAIIGALASGFRWLALFYRVPGHTYENVDLHVVMAIGAFFGAWVGGIVGTLLPA